MMGAKRIDLSGRRYGRLVVIRPSTLKRFGWECLCDCGKPHIVTTTGLNTGHSKSCGCYCKDVQRERMTVHGHAAGGNGKTPSPEYKVWVAMKSRCYDPKNIAFADYGGRGISVCEQWANDFSQFLLDMGPRPKGMTIDRIDNSKGYTPENCQWATMLQQARNKRNNRVLEHEGQSKTLAEWTEILGLSENTIRMRLKSGWPVSKAVTTPSMQGHKTERPDFDLMTAGR